jgi:hypothetical protein
VTGFFYLACKAHPCCCIGSVFFLFPLRIIFSCTDILPSAINSLDGRYLDCVHFGCCREYIMLLCTVRSQSSVCLCFSCVNFLFFVMLSIEPSPLHMLRKHSTTLATSPMSFYVFVCFVFRQELAATFASVGLKFLASQGSWDYWLSHPVWVDFLGRFSGFMFNLLTSCQTVFHSFTFPSALYEGSTFSPGTISLWPSSWCEVVPQWGFYFPP